LTSASFSRIMCAKHEELQNDKNMGREQKRLLFSREEIDNAVIALSKKINSDYRGRNVLLVGILKGCFVFLADLIRHLDIEVTVDFVILRSYGSATVSSGEIEVIKDLHESIEGKDVLIIEDILDTGLTLSHFKEHLLLRDPRSLKVCALLDKKARRKVDFEADYVGLTIEDGFIVGYGIDCDERYRNLPDIWVLTGEGSEA